MRCQERRRREELSRDYGFWHQKDSEGASRARKISEREGNRNIYTDTSLSLTEREKVFSF
jgi:hypothetical protein